MPEPTTPQPTSRGRLSGRALVLSIGLVFVTNVWILKTELLTGSYATGGTPPAAALGWLLLLALATPLLKRIRAGWALSRSEIILIYCFLTMAIPMSGYGIIRAFLPHLTVLSYYALPENKFLELWPMLPAWQKPNDHEIIRQCFEAADNERVPWGPWIAPLALWALFFLAIFLVIQCLLVFFRKQWVERERLTFPLLYIPLEIVGEGKQQGELSLAFVRNPIFWTGVAVAFVYNFTNILNAANPNVPAFGRLLDLGGLFTERPLDAVNPLRLEYFPQVIGLGYLVSLEVSLSVWLFFLLNKFVGVFGRAAGYEPAGFPYWIEQSAGGYVAIGLLLVWLARRHLWDALRKAASRPGAAADDDEPWTYRGAALGILTGGAFLFGWCRLSGLPGWLFAVLFPLLFLYALVFARIRAETGVPYSMLYPRDFPAALITNALSGTTMMRLTGPQGRVAFASLGWLSRHYYPEFMGAYQIDGFKLGDATGTSRRSWAWMLGVAMLTGFVWACWAHLSAYYQYGQNVVDGGSGFGDYRAIVAQQEYQAAERMIYHEVPADMRRTIAAGLGFLLTGGLAVCRLNLLKFPLHPLGYLIATAYGNECPLWFAFFLVWLLKILVLRLGGVKLYRTLTPAFIGLALGHFFFGGVVWGNITPFVTPDIAKRYWLPRV